MRTHNKTGRGKNAPRHVRIYRSMMRTEAWQALSAVEKAVLIELYALYNGENNGELFLSCREAARRCHINKDTASRAFSALEEKGFIRRRSKASIDWKLNLARCWILTEHPFPEGTAPTRDYQYWRRLDDKTAALENGQTAPQNRTGKKGAPAERIHLRDKSIKNSKTASIETGHR